MPQMKARQVMPGKFVAVTSSTCGQLDVSHRALRTSSMRSIALAFAASDRAHFWADAALRIYPLTIPATAIAAMANDNTTSTKVIPASSSFRARSK